MIEHLLDTRESLHELGYWIKKSDVKELLKAFIPRKDAIPKSAIDKRIEYYKICTRSFEGSCILSNDTEDGCDRDKHSPEPEVLARITERCDGRNYDCYYYGVDFVDETTLKELQKLRD